MCLCQTPDKRSDYALLQIMQKDLTAEASYVRRNINTNHEGDNRNSYIDVNQAHPTARNTSYASPNRSGSKWEMWIRCAIVAFLVFTSIGLHLKQKEVNFQQEQLNDSINKIGEIKQRLRERNITIKQNAIHGQGGNKSIDAAFGIKYNGNIRHTEKIILYIIESTL